jgi:hypothetical protein
VATVTSLPALPLLDVTFQARYHRATEFCLLTGRYIRKRHGKAGIPALSPAHMCLECNCICI